MNAKTVSQNWGPELLLRGHPRGYDFLLVINCTRGRILYRFRDSFRQEVQNRYIGLPILRITQTEGFPGTISVKLCLEVSG